MSEETTSGETMSEETPSGETKWVGPWESRYAYATFVGIDWKYEAAKRPKRKDGWNKYYPPEAERKKSRELQGSGREEWIASLPINPAMPPSPSVQRRLSQRGRGKGEGKERHDRSEAVPKPSLIGQVKEAVQSTMNIHANEPATQAERAKPAEPLTQPQQNKQPTTNPEPAKPAEPITERQQKGLPSTKTRAQIEQERAEKADLMASRLPDESMRQNLREILAAKWAKEDAAQGLSSVPEASRREPETTPSSSRVASSSQQVVSPAQPVPIAQPVPAATTAPMAQPEKRTDASTSVPKPTGTSIGPGFIDSNSAKEPDISTVTKDQSSAIAPAASAAQTERLDQQQAEHQAASKHEGSSQVEEAREQHAPAKHEAAVPPNQQENLGEPTEKTGPVAKMKSLLKGTLSGMQRSSLSVKTPDSVQRNKSVSFEDLPATIEPSQEGTEHAGESSATLEENKVSPKTPSGQHKGSDAVETYQSERNKLNPPLETDSTWPFPNASTEATPQNAREDEEDDAMLSSPSSPQDPTDPQQVNRYLQQQLSRFAAEVMTLRETGAKLRTELMEQSRLRAQLQYAADSWQEDKVQLQKEMEQLRLGSQTGEDALVVEQLKEQLQRQGQRVKQLLEEQETQGTYIHALNEELKLQQENHQNLIAEGTRVVGDRDDAVNEVQMQHELVQRLSETVKKEEEKATGLRNDMRRLKQRVVTASRRPEQVADDEIVQRMNSIYHDLRTFTVQELDCLGRRSDAQLDFSALPDSTKEWANSYIPLLTDADVIPAGRLRPYIFVSIICKTLCEAFKAHYYFGASAASPIQQAMSMARALRPERDYQTRQWFDVVSKLIDKKDGELLPQAEQALLREMVESVRCDFGSAISVSWTAEMEQKLGTLFKQALDLFRILHRQDARYFVDMAPAKGWTFSAAQMEEVVDLEEEPAALKGRAIGISVFPAVYKRGGMGGEDDLVTTVVSKARVIVKDKAAAVVVDA